LIIIENQNFHDAAEQVAPLVAACLRRCGPFDRAGCRRVQIGRICRCWSWSERGFCGQWRQRRWDAVSWSPTTIRLHIALSPASLEQLAEATRPCIAELFCRCLNSHGSKSPVSLVTGWPGKTFPTKMTKPRPCAIHQLLYTSLCCPPPQIIGLSMLTSCFCLFAAVCDLPPPR